MNTLLVLMSVFLGAQQVSPVDESPRQIISASDAQHLVVLALGKSSALAEVDYTKWPSDPGFYYFTVTSKNPKTSLLVGYYAVNPQTGDVWDAPGCRLVTNSKLRQAQKEMTRRLKLNDSEHKKYKQKAPLCMKEK